MKRLMAIMALLAASGLALAQAPANIPASGGTAGPRPQEPEKGHTLNDVANRNALQNKNEPEKQQQPAQPAGKHQPVAKTQEEFKAYQDAASKPDGPSAEAAADAFAQQYPQS